MYDYPELIKNFIQQNFVPATELTVNYRVTSRELLNFLFSVFPDGCIDDYDLNLIMHSLGYEPKVYYIEHTTELVVEGETKKQTERQLHTGWFLFSELKISLESEPA
jgi:hypothetical protein